MLVISAAPTHDPHNAGQLGGAYPWQLGVPEVFTTDAGSLDSSLHDIEQFLRDSEVSTKQALENMAQYDHDTSPVAPPRRVCCLHAYMRLCTGHLCPIHHTQAPRRQDPVVQLMTGPRSIKRTRDSAELGNHICGNRTSKS